MLKESPAYNAWAVIFENANFSLEFFKRYKIE